MKKTNNFLNSCVAAFLLVALKNVVKFKVQRTVLNVILERCYAALFSSVSFIATNIYGALHRYDAIQNNTHNILKYNLNL